jgi:AcrR family transcriptional regulator
VLSARSQERLDEILGAATRLFCARGYRRTQVADVARELGVSSGLVYHYFESKDALFDAVLRHSFDRGEGPRPASLPIPTPARDATLAFVRARVERGLSPPLFRAALARNSVSDARAELEGVARELYSHFQRTRRGADLMERSALDLPDLAELWFGDVRHRFFEQLTAYVAKRMESGDFRRLPDPATAARAVVEVLVFFARHRHRDPFEKLDDEAARETVVGFVLNALLADA